MRVSMILPFKKNRKKRQQRVGCYLVLDILGEGTSSIVYRAKDTITGNQVALKVFRKDCWNNRFRSSDLAEVTKCAAGLQHPHVVQLYEHGRAQGVYYLSMELVNGRSLNSYLEEGRVFSQDEVLDVAVQSLEGLHCLHDHGIVHRDIRCSNVLMTETGNVKITDFGLSKFLLRTSASTTGAPAGTTEYASPEQVMCKGTDKRSDLYSMGIVLYKLVTGRLPFGGEQGNRLIHRILSEEPPAPVTIREGISPYVSAIIMKALKKRPAERYNDPEKMMGDCALARKLVIRNISIESLSTELSRISREFRGEILEKPFERLGIGGVLRYLGTSYLELTRKELGCFPIRTEEALLRSRKSLEYLDLTGEKELLIQAHFHLFKLLSLLNSRESALRHMRKSFSILDEVVSGKSAEEKVLFLKDRTISMIIKEAEALVNGRSADWKASKFFWQID